LDNIILSCSGVQFVVQLKKNAFDITLT